MSSVRPARLHDGTTREGTTLAASDPSAGPPVIVCDVRGIGRADLGTVDALARMQLAARQAGLCMRIAGASAELRELLTLAGLDEALPCLEDEPPP